MLRKASILHPYCTSLFFKTSLDISSARNRIALPQFFLLRTEPMSSNRKGVWGSLSTLGFARQASPVVPFVNSFRSEPILLIWLPLSCFTAFPVDALTGGCCSCRFRMLSHENMKDLFCVHSTRRARDSAFRFDLVFFPGGAVGEYSREGSSRPRCRVVPKWLAIAAAVHLVIQEFL